MTYRRLAQIAGEVVAVTQHSLPAQVRELALPLPVCFEPRPNDAILAEGWEPDILGLFVGPSHGDDPGEPAPLPSQILLFLENIWDYAEDDETIYRNEVRVTYLHELGHYLGWDESDLAARGLD
jgi:predicted Zn-dependent protease with MMP-like domain